MDEVWDPHWFGPTKTLDVHISWLRKKIEDDPARPALHHHDPRRGLPVPPDAETRRRPRRSARRLVLAFAYILVAVIVALTVPLAVNLRGVQDRARDATMITAQTLAA